MQIELTRLFVKVIQNGSFSKAAESLKIPKSTVSKSISRLENETGTKLILRTTRSLTLTAAGKAFYETCLQPLQILEDAQKSLYGQDSILSGTVKITAPEDLGSHIIAPAIGQLIHKHPHLNFELNYTDEIVDLIKDGFDLAIRIGKLSESSLKAKKIGEIILIPVASPAYLKSIEKIRTPKDIEKYSCLSLSIKSASKWKLRHGKQSEQLDIRPRITSNQMTSLIKSSLAGGGIAFVPLYLCKESLEHGQLIRILPDWAGESLPVSIVSPISTSSSARIKIVTDTIIDSLRKVL